MGEEKAQTEYRGRLAPTPSGFLHLGHVRTFSTAWERAREVNGQLVFRMDDLILPLHHEFPKRAWRTQRNGFGLG